MRTYHRETWEAAQYAWEHGDFSPEWRETRHRTAMRGIIFPPNGTKWDGWDEDGPSQRAIIIRAIRETPEALERTIARSKSWSEVVVTLMREYNDASADAATAERRHRDVPTHVESAQSIKAILDRIANS